jgi:DNA helicase-2/ATP-dependent DNA helicase PcrA
MRIAHMVRSGLAPESIVGLSFTNKAAREMRERLSHLLGRRLASRVTLTTFHSYALGLLREFPEQAGLSKGFGVCDEKDALELLQDSVVEARVQEFFSLAYFRERIAQLKDELCSPDEVGRRHGFVDAHLVAAVYSGYERRLRLHNLVDFDDLVYLSFRMMMRCEDVRHKVRSRHTHFLVDEYQDTSAGQFSFLRLVVPEESGNICVVGDDDQSIYGWRGARPGILKLFLDTFTGARRVTLDQNYRCSPVILRAANAVIEVNDGRLSKELWSERSDSEPIRVFRAEAEDDEASYVAHQIGGLVANGTAPEQCAVLYRASSLARAVAQALAARGLATRLVASSSLLERREARDLLAVLKGAARPLDGLAGIRAAQALGHRMSLEDQTKVLTGLDGERFGRESLGSSQEIQSLREHLMDATSVASLSTKVGDWFETSMLRSRYRSESSSMERALAREEVVRRCLRYLEKIEDAAGDAPTQGLALLESLLDKLAVGSWESREEGPTGRVQLMTIHAAKGLEFDHVFVIGLEEGILPHEKSLESGSEAEERRLMYVAMTRARKTLHLTSAATRSSGSGLGSGRRVSTRPSRYLEQIPLSLVSDGEDYHESLENKRRDAARRLFEMFR